MCPSPLHLFISPLCFPILHNQNVTALKTSEVGMNSGVLSMSWICYCVRCAHRGTRVKGTGGLLVLFFFLFATSYGFILISKFFLKNYFNGSRVSWSLNQLANGKERVLIMRSAVSLRSCYMALPTCPNNWTSPWALLKNRRSNIDG